MKMNTTKKRLRAMVLKIILLLVSLIVLWVVIHQVLTAYEKGKYPPMGASIEVNGEKMHVYAKGNGKQTIVLLSGLGTTAPMLDFEPLINELARKNKVVVVEGFGYGWSDVTHKKRTVENIVEELRTALKKSGIEGPYILMPHSVSGIYSMYYANHYPDEIRAVIGIDPTLPQAFAYFGESAPTAPSYMSLAAPTGVVRLAMLITPADFLPRAEEGLYSVASLDKMKAITAWKGYNRNIVDETNEIGSNVAKTADMAFPPNVPVLIFTKKENREGKEGKTNETFYRTQLPDDSVSRMIVMEGSHYLHWTKYKEISLAVEQFTSDISEKGN